ncbi:MAG: hypothetical protein QW153_00445 [Candidatus Bilamarchaeaceae archaeon]
MVDLDFIVKYPFTKEAKDIVSNIEVSESLVDKAVELILSALSGKIVEKIYIDDIEKKESIVVYATARMILGAMRNRYVVSRFAVAYSKLARKNINNESREGIKKLLEEFNIRVKDGKIFLPDYLKYTPRDSHYALVNRQLNGGWVVINSEEEKRIIEEAIRKHLEVVPLLKNPPPFISRAVEEIEKRMPRQEDKRLPVAVKGDYPPCISYLIEELKKHHNLSHQARWFLAVYLINIGLSDEEIVSLFSNSPDFSEKITRYQVEHARKKGYKVPNCASVTSFGLCRAACGITTPIQWRGKKNGSK